jgi:tetratricopeptide (TPR) repeat protein
MKKQIFAAFFAVFLLLMLGGNIQAQPSLKEAADALRKEIAGYPKQDTVKAEKIILLGSYLMHIDPVEAMKVTEQAEILCRKINWERGTISVWRQKGSIYTSLAEYDKAIAFQLKALHGIENFKKFSREKSLIGRGSIYNNMAISYTRMKMPQKAIDCNKKALHLFQQTNDKEALSASYLNLSTSYLDNKQLEEAERYVDQAYAVAQKISYFILYPYYFSNKGNIYNQRKRYAESIAYYSQGLEISKKMGVTDLLTEMHLGMGEAYYFSGNFQMAEQYLSDGLQMATDNSLGNRKYEAMGLLAETYGKLKKYDLAFKTYKDFAAARDSIIGSEKKEEIARKEVQFEADKKQAAADAEIGRQKVIRYGTLMISGVLLLTGLVWFTGYRKRRNAKEIQRELLHRAKISDVEMRVLRLQMNPHFIFNSLNSISDYMNKNDIKTADYYLSKFAKLMRGILENAEEKEIPLADELKMLELYMQLEASRLNGKFTYEIRVDPAINPEITMVPPLILQPFVENSIWHGMAQKNGSGKILIEAKFEDDMLQCIVEDDGVGRKTGEKTNVKSYGMKITKDRIELLNKFKNTAASVRLIDLEQGTRVELRLPINEDDI